MPRLMIGGMPPGPTSEGQEWEASNFSPLPVMLSDEEPMARGQLADLETSDVLK